MESPTQKPSISLDRIVDDLLRHTSKDQIRGLVEAAVSTSGQVVGYTSFEPGDDICPTFKFPFPFPPRFEQFLLKATAIGPFRVFPIGTPNPFEIIVQTKIGRVG